MRWFRPGRALGPTARIVSIIGGTLVLGVSLMRFPGVLDVSVDSSWHLILAAGILEGWQSGVDLVYTYGPLGYFGVPHQNYVRELYDPAVAFSLVAGLIMAWVFVMRGAGLRGWLRRLAYLVILGVLVPILSPVGDALALLAIVGSADLAIAWVDEARPPRRAFAIVGAPALLGVLSLIKFTYLILSVVGVTALVVVSSWRRLRGRAAAAGSVYLAAILVSWIAAGQRPANLPEYVRRSWDLAAAYNDAMSLPPDRAALVLAVAAVVAIGALVVVGGRDRFEGVSRPVGAVPVLAAVALAWKAGFGRYDWMHAGILFSVAAVAPLFVDPPEASHVRRARIFPWLQVTAVSIALAGAFHVARPMGWTPGRFAIAWRDRVASNVHTLLNLDASRAAADALLEDESRAKALPRIRDAVGSRTVDMFHPDQALVFLNGLTYTPRPVPQGYLAVTPSLLELNARFYEDPSRAPTYVLFGVTPLDRRFPTLEDSQALQVLLRAYDPVLVENGVFLMRRDPDSEPTIGRRRLLMERDVTPGQWTDVPATGDGFVLASVRLRRSLAGRIRSLVYQCPPVLLEVERTDGTRLSGRLIPAISQEPFLVSPLMRNGDDWLRLFQGRAPLDVKALRIVPRDDRMSACLDPDIRVRLFDWEGPQRHDATRK